jgi:hypothetical protein
VVKVQQVARIGIAGKVKARGGGDAGTSLTTSNAEIARNTYAPKEFWALQPQPTVLLNRELRSRAETPISESRHIFLQL